MTTRICSKCEKEISKKESRVTERIGNSYRFFHADCFWTKEKVDRENENRVGK